MLAAFVQQAPPVGWAFTLTHLEVVGFQYIMVQACMPLQIAVNTATRGVPYLR